MVNKALGFNCCTPMPQHCCTVFELNCMIHVFSLHRLPFSMILSTSSTLPETCLPEPCRDPGPVFCLGLLRSLAWAFSSGIMLWLSQVSWGPFLLPVRVAYLHGEKHKVLEGTVVGTPVLFSHSCLELNLIWKRILRFHEANKYYFLAFWNL